MKKVLIIAGHGQGDPGAVGNGKQEANLTRDLAQALYKHLRWNMENYVHLYDTSKDLYRNDPSIMKNYDEIIEIHFNSAANPSATGTEVLIAAGTNADGIDNAILNVLSKYFPNRGIKQRNDLKNMSYALQYGKAYRLVEVCFISNASDVQTFVNNCDKIARDLTTAIRPLIGFKEEETMSNGTLTFDQVKALPDGTPIVISGNWLNANENLDVLATKKGTNAGGFGVSINGKAGNYNLTHTSIHFDFERFKHCSIKKK